MGERIDWRQVRNLVAAGAVGALIVSAVPAVAAVGESLILGESNTADAPTDLSGDTSTNLAITNTNSDGVALDLAVEPGNSPLTVNSGKKVKNLNADKLDGKSSGKFLLKKLAPRAASKTSNDLPDGNNSNQTLLQVSIDAPAPGMLQITASADSRLVFLDSWSQFSCWVSVDSGKLRGSEYWVLLSAGANDTDFIGPYNWEENCATVASAVVAKGSHVVKFRTNSTDFTNFHEGTLNVLWVPFDGSGDVPVSFTDLSVVDVASENGKFGSVSEGERLGSSH